MNSKTLRSLMGASLLLGSVAAASANSTVTFQVDMSNEVANATFNPSTMTMAARGSFNGWTPWALTNNPNGANTNLWTGTFLVTSNVYSGTTVSPNGTVMNYKYTIEPAGTYETVFLAGGHNRLLLLPGTSNPNITAPYVFYSDSQQTLVTNEVTFEVDLAQQINTGAFVPGTSTSQARGIFNSWGTGGNTIAQTNDPTILRTNSNHLVTSNVYVGTYQIVGSPGQTIDYKYFIDTGANWESPAPGTGDPNDNNNRFFNLGSGTTQTLPIVFFGDSPFAPVATNAVTFQVDMSSQILVNNFNPATGTVELRGDFNGWGTPQILCTNDPSAVNTNIYKTTVSIVDGVGATRQYKFWSSVTANGGWETMANNRSMQIIGGPPNPTPNVLPPVYFDNLVIDPASRLPADTIVTFSVSMTNAVGTDAHVFNPATDTVWINGVPAAFATWDSNLPQCTNNPVGSGIYSIDILAPKGSPVQQVYKYGINAVDDEAAAGLNHVRYIRSTGTYVMPMDVFGNQLVETSFGSLKASHSTPGNVMVSWLGRPGVHLQTKSSLSSGSWVDHPETDAMNATNWPTGGGTLFFRLVNP